MTQALICMVLHMAVSLAGTPTILTATPCKVSYFSRPGLKVTYFQRNRVEREVGGGIGMGNTCNSMADSCQCMTKPTAML